ncbi:MAG TPA: DUF5317 domain-containing protein [Candidatus Cryosericum sp.]|nr:DUF5317 domain-containing protein [Candidatus Cryosericum sp.]
MFVLIVLVCSLILSLATGGRLRYVEGFRFRMLPLGIGAFVLQVLMFTERGELLLGSFLPFAYMCSLLMLLVFLGVNWKVAGVPVLVAGLLLNMVVIGANGGRMPASPQALIATGQADRAELLVREGAAANVVLMSDRTRLNVLGDRIVLPFLGTLGSAYSIGDLVALVGEALLVYGMVRKPAVGEPRQPVRDPGQAPSNR